MAELRMGLGASALVQLAGCSSQPSALVQLAGCSSQPSALASSGSRQARPRSDQPASRTSAPFPNTAPLQSGMKNYG
jgi:hypothetical protein